MKNYYIMVDEKNHILGQQLANTKDRAIVIFERHTGIKAIPLTMNEFRQTSMYYHEQN